jgi:hypothetical protein
MFAAELIETREFVGFIGLLTMTFAVPSFGNGSYFDSGTTLFQKGEISGSDT